MPGAHAVLHPCRTCAAAAAAGISIQAWNLAQYPAARRRLNCSKACSGSGDGSADATSGQLLRGSPTTATVAQAAGWRTCPADCAAWRVSLTFARQLALLGGVSDSMAICVRKSNARHHPFDRGPGSRPGRPAATGRRAGREHRHIAEHHHAGAAPSSKCCPHHQERMVYAMCVLTNCCLLSDVWDRQQRCSVRART